MRKVLLLFALFIASHAAAHPLLQNAMWIQFESDRIHVAVNVSVKEIAVVHHAAKAEDETFDVDAIAVTAEKHGAYVIDHLHFAADGHALAGKVSKITAPLLEGAPEQTFLQYEIEYPISAQPSVVTLRHDILREYSYAAGTPWDVTYTVRSKRIGESDVVVTLLRRDAVAKFAIGNPAVPPAQPDNARTFREYLWHGMMHILTGYDHLLFVGALVLATLSFWEMFKVVAAFTLAHTITLGLAVFHLVRLPVWVVEPVIAASIVFVALENVLWPRRAHSRIRLAVAFGFGLVHGLGFAGGLLEAMEGLPAIGIWIALTAFSLGVEIGHQVVVLPLFGALALGRNILQESFTKRAVRCCSVAISVGGAYYLFSAIHEQFFSR